MQKVLLVDEQDHPIGFEEKQTAHEKALLHRAFSVFLYHEHKLLLQKRAEHKYHCGGLWTNICCSHPLDEQVIVAAKQRLREETGITQVELEEIGILTYRAEFSNGLVEHEVDHILFGCYELEEFHPNLEEVSEIKWMDIDAIHLDIQKHPEAYTPWFLQALDQVEAHIQAKVL